MTRQSTITIGDLNGPLHYCGAARYAMTPTPAPRTHRPLSEESAPFGDLAGPLSYWGPAPTPAKDLARVA